MKTTSEFELIFKVIFFNYNNLFLNFLKMIVMNVFGYDHEIEFHKIKIRVFHKIEGTITRSKVVFFMRSHLNVMLL